MPVVPSPPSAAAPGRSSTSLDRAADERSHPQLWPRLLSDPATRVLELRGGLLPIRPASDGSPVLELRPVRPGETAVAPGEAGGPLLIFLGRPERGSATVAAVYPDDDAAPSAAGVVWAAMRDVGPELSPLEQELAMTATGLSNWHRTHPRCPRCGQPTRPKLGGWVRRCDADGSEHYPRTDPAVIMAVIDGDDRVLLGRSPAWAPGRVSVLAGFVEPGERLEAAVAREVFEEVGVVVGAVDYVDSQPWPFPASLMLGFLARAESTALHLDPNEIAEAQWYSRDELISAVAERRIGLPGRLSIARRLLERWYGEPLTAPDEHPWRAPE